MDVHRFFASDNSASVHPKVLEALANANGGHAISYGDDPVTRRAEDVFRAQLGDDAEVFFVYNGTAANVLGLQSAIRSYNGIVCTTVSHINEDECGAPEKFTGSKLLAVPTTDGRLSEGDLVHFLADHGNEHRSQPGIVSITQATEVGTVYSPQQISNLAKFAHDNGMFLHMDGARLANAAVFLGADIRSFTADAGVDVLSFGGTKNGLMFGEAVVFFRPELAANFKYIRKQGMQLASKMRYVAAQFEVYLGDGLWKSNAEHANRMANRLASGAVEIPGVSLAYPVEANGVFARIPTAVAEPLRAIHPFYDWEHPYPDQTVARWMASFDTTEEDVDRFVTDLKSLVMETVAG